MEKIGKPILMVSKKITRSVRGQKIKFEGKFITNVMLNEKTLKLRRFVMKNTNDQHLSGKIPCYPLILS